MSERPSERATERPIDRTELASEQPNERTTERPSERKKPACLEVYVISGLENCKCRGGHYFLALKETKSMLKL